MTACRFDSDLCRKTVRNFDVIVGDCQIDTDSLAFRIDFRQIAVDASDRCRFLAARIGKSVDFYLFETARKGKAGI